MSEGRRQARARATNHIAEVAQLRRDYDELRRTGAEMREVQRRYFQKRDRSDLILAQKLEARFDELISGQRRLL